MTWKRITTLDQQAGIGTEGRSYRFKAADLVDHADKLGIGITKMSPSSFTGLDELPQNPDTEKRIQNADPSFPIMALQRDDGTHQIIDGTHRARKAIRDGLESVPVRVLTHDQMKPFLSDNPVE